MELNKSAIRNKRQKKVQRKNDTENNDLGLWVKTHEVNISKGGEGQGEPDVLTMTLAHTTVAQLFPKTR